VVEDNSIAWRSTTPTTGVPSTCGAASSRRGGEQLSWLEQRREPQDSGLIHGQFLQIFDVVELLDDKLLLLPPQSSSIARTDACRATLATRMLRMFFILFGPLRMVDFA
jgi:hypothetical protein